MSEATIPAPVDIGFREDERNPAHVRVSVFVGNRGARGHSGQIVLRADEWDDFRRKLPGSIGDTLIEEIQ